MRLKRYIYSASYAWSAEGEAWVSCVLPPLGPLGYGEGRARVRARSSFLSLSQLYLSYHIKKNKVAGPSTRIAVVGLGGAGKGYKPAEKDYKPALKGHTPAGKGHKIP